MLAEKTISDVYQLARKICKRYSVRDHLDVAHETFIVLLSLKHRREFDQAYLYLVVKQRAIRHLEYSRVLSSVEDEARFMLYANIENRTLNSILLEQYALSCGSDGIKLAALIRNPAAYFTWALVLDKINKRKLKRRRSYVRSPSLVTISKFLAFNYATARQLAKQLKNKLINGA